VDVLIIASICASPFEGQDSTAQQSCLLGGLISSLVVFAFRIFFRSTTTSDV